MVFIEDGCNDLAIVVDVDGLSDLPGNHIMHENGTCDNTNGKSTVARLAALPPSFELETMRSKSCQVLLEICEPEPLFQIIPAVVIIEKQLMNRTSTKDRITHIITTLPDMSYYLLSIRILQ